MPRGSHVKGSEALARRLKTIEKFVVDGINDELDEVARDLRDRARALAPQLEGDLVGSIDVSSGGARSFVRVVSSDSPYAVIRHEDFYNLGPVSQAKGGSSDGVVGRKYLERPFLRHRARYVEQIGTRISREIARASH